MCVMYAKDLYFPHVLDNVYDNKVEHISQKRKTFNSLAVYTAAFSILERQNCLFARVRVFALEARTCKI